MNDYKEVVINRPLPKPFYKALKNATQVIIDGLHGLEAVASLTRGKKSAFSNYANINETPFIGADQIADLESCLGEMPVTTELARIQGYALVKLPESNTDKNWIMEFSSLAKESGKSLDKLAHAINDDGDVSAQEIDDLNLRLRTQKLIQVLVNIDAQLLKIQEADSSMKRR